MCLFRCLHTCFQDGVACQASAYLLDELNGKSPQLAELLDNSVIEVLILGYGFFFAAAVLTLFFRPKRAALEE